MNQSYTGLKVVGIHSDELDAFYQEGKLNIDYLPMQSYYPNEFLVLKSDNKPSALGIIKEDNVLKIDENLQACGIKPKNKEQKCALDALLDPSIQVVTLAGVAGGGKTLLSIAAALKQSFGKEALYHRILYVKSVDPVGRDVGFLPGNMEEKIAPFMGPLRDSINICKIDKDIDKLTGFDEKSKIQMLSTTHLRGRTFRKIFMLIDEVQNLNITEIKTILTRLDNDCKVVLVGDTSQADVNYSDNDKGFTKVIETFKDSDLFAHLTFKKSERSKLAQLVSERL